MPSRSTTKLSMVFSVAALLLLLVQCANASDDATATDQKHLRSALRRTTTATSEDLFCMVEWVDKMTTTESSLANEEQAGTLETTFHDEFRCRYIDNGEVMLARYPLELPEMIAREQKHTIMTSDDSFFYLRIPSGSIDDESFRIVIPDSTTLEVVTPHVAGVAAPPTRRHLAEANRRQTALVIRVVDSNGNGPPDSKDALYTKIFQADTSLKYQYEKCSSGQTIINPKEDVMEVRIDLPVERENQVDAAIFAAERSALQQLNSRGISVRSLEQYADLVIFVTPESGLWLAYATIGGSTSVYNGNWGGQVHALMHEVGHNFKLWHANDEIAYADHTGYMSGSISGYHDNRDGFPANCFNAANHWELGWYTDRRTSFSGTSAPQIVKMTPFVDYRDIPAGTDYQVLVEILHNNKYLYAQYNRAKSFNSDTHDHRDKLVIVREDGDGTELVAALGSSGDSYDNIVHVCDTVARNGAAPEHLVVSIGNGSACPSYNGGGFVSQQADTGNVSNGSCGIPLTICRSNFECCSNRCSPSSTPGVSVCAAALSDLTSDRRTPDIRDNRNRAKSGNLDV